MSRFLKALAAIMLMIAMFFITGCKPEETEEKGSIYGTVTDFVVNKNTKEEADFVFLLFLFCVCVWRPGQGW